jgi:predicted nucleic acid-binding protein
MEIVVDASAIMAVIVKEPERDLVIQLTKDALIISPNMMNYEIANGLTKIRRIKCLCLIFPSLLKMRQKFLLRH